MRAYRPLPGGRRKPHRLVATIVLRALTRPAPMLQVATIVLRGSTEQFLDDVERAMDDGVNAYKALCRWGWGGWVLRVGG